MIKHSLYIWVAILLLVTTSCSKEQEAEGRHTLYALAFTVSSDYSRAANGEVDADGEESRIRSLYIYAFDDNYPQPDYYAEPSINNGQGVTGEYNIRMDIYDKGTKRFYVIANPPAYVLTQLVPSCSEQRLKALTIQLQQPIYRIAELPQNMDGLTEPADKGFPMGNVLTAQAVLSDDASRKMSLLPASDGVETSTQPIQSIPLIRTLGKIRVKAYLHEGNTTPVTVTDLKIYNFTCNGSFLPVWNTDVANWTDDGGQAVWNPAKTLDLTTHVLQETKLQPVITSVFGSDLTAGTSHPGYIDGNYTKENAKEMTAFYLCQNSYGKKVDADTQEGLEDVIGNRTTCLVVSLSDGRHSEIRLPYLRRNDLLTVRLGISQYAIQFDFQLWNLSTVDPDWSEGVVVPTE